MLLQQPSASPITPYLELRERFERRVNRDLAKGTSDDRNDLLSRWRLGAAFRLGNGFTGEVRYQFANDQYTVAGSDAATTNSDVDLAYVSHRLGGGSLTVGRQKVAIGSQRLIGPLEWVNVPRSFDGFRFKDRTWEAFATNVSVGVPRPRWAKIAGLVNTNRLGLTQLYLKHDDAAAGVVENATLDQMVTRRAGEFSLELEGAIQAGRTAGKRQEGWALHARATRALGKLSNGYVEGNAASGGSGPSVISTFDNLYPTNHPFYGIMDLQSWRNMAEVAVGVDQRLSPSLLARLSYHRLGLLNKTDGWYAASGALNPRPGGVYRDPTGRSGMDVGQEIDLEAVWTARKNCTLSAGIAGFAPGRFVSRAAPQEAQAQTWGYIQFQIRF
jgi:hypothetical protein